MTRGPGSAPLDQDLAPPDTSRVLAPAPAVSTNFVALGGSSPPSDGALAVGPSAILELVNGNPGVDVGIYDKTGRTLRITGLAALLGIDLATFMGDPRAHYDPVSARWYVLAFGFSHADPVPRLHLGISLGPDPTGGFCDFSADTSVLNGVSGVVVPDFPGLGMDEYALYVTMTRFNIATGRVVDTQVEMIPRSDLGCDKSSLNPWIWNVTTRLPDGTALWEVQPATALSPSGAGYLIGTSWSGGSYVGLWTITRAASPELVKDAFPVSPYKEQAAAAQPGTTTTLNISDTRVPSSPVFRNGSLWFTFSAQSSRSTYAAVRWYELKVPAMVVGQWGEISSATSNWSYPALTVDASGGVTILASSVGPGDFPNASFFAKSAGDATATPVRTITLGGASYVGDGTRNPARWGDYFGIALDPDGQTVWGEASYSRPGGASWQTAIGATRVAATPASSYAVTVSDPNPIAGTAMTVRAQALGASGAPLPSPGLTVAWSAVPAGTGTFATPTTATDANGIATVQFTTGAAAPITYTITATGTIGGAGSSGPFTTRPKPAPTTSLYLPNVTKTLGGPDGFQTPFIVQNVGTVNTTLEVNFYRFADGSLVTKRVVGGLAPGASFADVPNNDADLPGDTQFSVRIDSFGAPVVSVVNQHKGNIEADAYSAASVGATTVYLPNVVRRFFGYHSPIIIQNLGNALATVTATFRPFAGGPSPAITRNIAPGQSQFIEPNIEPSLTDGTQYAVTLNATQPIAAVVNTHNDDPGVSSPVFYSANGITTGAASVYGPYAVKNANGGRISTIVVQNVGTAVASPTLTFTPLGGGPAKTFTASAPVAAGSAWVFDPRFVNGIATADPTKLCSPGAQLCLADGEYSFVAQSAGGMIAAMVNIIGPDSAMGYTASAAPARTYFLPNVLASYFGWTTPVFLQSVGATTATLSWTPFGGGPAFTRVVPLVPGQAVRIDPNASVGGGVQYAVKVVADGLLTAIVMELNTSLGGDNAMTYSGFAATP